MATRMQQRRGTASQWTSANPVLAAGEIGYETDTTKFKIGDGTTAWSTLKYFLNLDDLDVDVKGFVRDSVIGAANGVASLDDNAQIPINQLFNVIQNAPDALNTLAELASGIEDANGIVNTAINTAIAAEVVHRDEAIEVETTNRINAISEEATDRTNAISAEATAREEAIAVETLARETAIDGVNSAIGSLTTANVAENSDFKYFTDERAQDAIANALTNGTGINVTYNDAANTITIATDATVATKTYADTGVSTHSSATTNIHGISDTANLVVTSDSRLSDTRTPTDGSVTTAKIADSSVTSAKIANGTIVDADINGSAAIATSKISGLDAALTDKASKTSPTLAGTVTITGDIVVSGNATISGTTTTIDTANLAVTDSIIYLSDTQYASDILDIGFYGAYGTSGGNIGNHKHTGLVRDHTDGKWKLFSNGVEEGSSTVDLTGATLDTLKLGGVEFSDGTQVKQGVPSLTTINQQTGAYTTVLTDRDKLVEISSSTGVTLTIPTNASVAYPVGTSFDILQTGTGQITIAGASGVTVNATPGLKLRTQWSSATLFKRATDTWVIYGDLTA